VGELKARSGGDIMVAGGGTVARALIAAGVIDELHLFVNPVALGGGMPVFPAADTARHLEIVHAQRFECGIPGLHLRPKASGGPGTGGRTAGPAVAGRPGPATAGSAPGDRRR